MLNDNRIEILIARFFSGEASPEEAIQLEVWARTSPLNESYLNTCSRLFLMTAHINYNDGKNRVWENIKNIAEKNDSEVKRKVINWRLAGVAASIILTLAIGLLINNGFKKENDKIFYQAGASAKKILLNDSSEIIVSPNSSITIDKEYGAVNRKIRLNGSAYFSVIHNPSRAFIIDISTLHIKDLGTVFKVVTSPTGDTVLINVIEGEVSVYDDFGSSANASAGEKVMYSKLEKELQVLPIQQMPNMDPAIKKKIHSIVPPKDSPAKNYSYSFYPSRYLPREGYTAEGRRALMYKDSVETRRITTDMLKDGLIRNERPLSFKLSNEEFIINGKYQNDAVFQRYRKKYVPSAKAGKEWVWSHNLTDMPTKQQ